MKLISGIVALSASLAAGLAHAEVQQVFVASHAEASRSCELQSYDDIVPFKGITQAEKTTSECAVSVPKEAFDRQFQYCALSGIRQYNDGWYENEHDYGSHCNFQVEDDQVVFEASRGFGLSEGSTSSLFCSFTCVANETAESIAGEDLEVIKSTPLPDWN